MAISSNCPACKSRMNAPDAAAQPLALKAEPLDQLDELEEVQPSESNPARDVVDEDDHPFQRRERRFDRGEADLAPALSGIVHSGGIALSGFAAAFGVFAVFLLAGHAISGCAAAFGVFALCLLAGLSDSKTDNANCAP